jgi:putative transposase
MITVLQERPERLPMATACNALGLNRSTVYQWSKLASPNAEPL